MEPVWFNIFINDIDSGIKCSLNKSAHSIKVSGAFYMPEGQSAIQRDLKKHEKQAYVNLTRFKAECRILHMCQGRLWY